MSEQSVLIGSVLVVIFLISLVPIVGGFLQVRRDQQFRHSERLKALEMGREWPDDAVTARIKAAFGQQQVEENDRAALARKCFSTALWVAFWGFAAAGNHGSMGMNTGVAQFIAAATGAVGVTALACGAFLAAAVPVGSTLRPEPKAVSESDAFDVVSSRG